MPGEMGVRVAKVQLAQQFMGFEFIGIVTSTILGRVIVFCH